MIELGITKALHMDQPTDGQKEIWVRQQPPLVVDVLESCFDVIHDFYAFYIISALEILNFVHFLQKHYKVVTDGRTDRPMDGHTLLESRFVATKNVNMKYAESNPEKSWITNSIFLAPLKIEVFPFFLEDVWVSWGPSRAEWNLGRNLHQKNVSIFRIWWDHAKCSSFDGFFLKDF